AAEVLAAGGQPPHTDKKVLVATETRRGVREIGAAQPAAGPAERIADRGNSANPRFAPEVVFHSADANEGVVVNDVVPRSGANRYAPEVGIADAPVHFAARKDWYLLIVDEANPAAEIRNHILTEAETEREDVVALDEERALLREEQRKPRQVRSTCIDFCLREVRVERRGRQDVRAEPLVDVET